MPGVADVDRDLPSPGRAAPATLDEVPAEAELDLARGRELQRVREQVEDDLADPARVAEHAGRELVVHRVDQLDVVIGRRRREQVEGAFDDPPQVHRLGVELDLAGLDLGEVEDVVDDGQQRIARCLDRLGVLLLLGVERRVEQQPAHPDDRVHRRPDLVAHRREERALGLVRVLGGAARPRAPRRRTARSRSRSSPAARAPRRTPSSASVNGLPGDWRQTAIMPGDACRARSAARPSVALPRPVRCREPRRRADPPRRC